MSFMIDLLIDCLLVPQFLVDGTPQQQQMSSLADFLT
jgi:hypothetical protein